MSELTNPQAILQSYQLLHKEARELARQWRDISHEYAQDAERARASGYNWERPYAISNIYKDCARELMNLL